MSHLSKVKCRKQINHVGETIKTWRELGGNLWHYSIDQTGQYIGVLLSTGVLQIWCSIILVGPILSFSLPFSELRSPSKSGVLAWSLSSKRIAFADGVSTCFICDTESRTIKTVRMSLPIISLSFYRDSESKLMGVSIAQNSVILIDVGHLVWENDQIDCSDSCTHISLYNSPSNQLLNIQCISSNNDVIATITEKNMGGTYEFHSSRVVFGNPQDKQSTGMVTHLRSAQLSLPSGGNAGNINCTLSLDGSLAVLSGVVVGHDRAGEGEGEGDSCCVFVFATNDHTKSWTIQLPTGSQLIYASCFSIDGKHIAVLRASSDGIGDVLVYDIDSSSSSMTIVIPTNTISLLEYLRLEDVQGRLTRNGIVLWGSTTSSSLFTLEHTYESIFAGPMYPAGYRILDRAVDYLEAEDELDIVMHQNTPTWNESKATNASSSSSSSLSSSSSKVATSEPHGGNGSSSSSSSSSGSSSHTRTDDAVIIITPISIASLHTLDRTSKSKIRIKLNIDDIKMLFGSNDSSKKRQKLKHFEHTLPLPLPLPLPSSGGVSAMNMNDSHHIATSPNRRNVGANVDFHLQQQQQQSQSQSQQSQSQSQSQSQLPVPGLSLRNNGLENNRNDGGIIDNSESLFLQAMSGVEQQQQEEDQVYDDGDLGSNELMQDEGNRLTSNQNNVDLSTSSSSVIHGVHEVIKSAAGSDVSGSVLVGARGTADVGVGVVDSGGGGSQVGENTTSLWQTCALTHMIGIRTETISNAQRNAEKLFRRRQIKSLRLLQQQQEQKQLQQLQQQQQQLQLQQQQQQQQQQQSSLDSVDIDSTNTACAMEVSDISTVTVTVTATVTASNSPIVIDDDNIPTAISTAIPTVPDNQDCLN